MPAVEQICMLITIMTWHQWLVLTFLRKKKKKKRTKLIDYWRLVMWSLGHLALEVGRLLRGNSFLEYIHTHTQHKSEPPDYNITHKWNHLFTTILTKIFDSTSFPNQKKLWHDLEKQWLWILHEEYDMLKY